MKKRVLAITLCLVLAAMFTTPALAAPSGANYFPFDDMTGVTATGDRSNNTGGTITFAEGKVGNAAVLDGATGISLGNDIIKGDTYTVAMWVKLDQVTQFTPTFFGLAHGDPIRWISLTPSSWAEVFGVWSDSGDGHWNDLFDLKKLPANEWVHVAFTSEPAGDYNKLGLYLNGKDVLASVNQREELNNLFMDGGEFYIGVNLWDVPLKGMVDELYIYNGKALTAAQIGDVMNATGAAPAPAGPNPGTSDNMLVFIAVGALVVTAAGLVVFRKKVTE